MPMSDDDYIIEHFDPEDESLFPPENYHLHEHPDDDEEG